MGACFGIDLIKVLFKAFFGKPVKSVWEPVICRELVKDVLFSSFFCCHFYSYSGSLCVSQLSCVTEWLGCLQPEKIV